MSGGGGQQGAAAPAQGQMGQGAGQPQGGGMPQQQQPQINPQTIQDVQNLIQQYHSGQLGGAQRGFAFGGFTGGSSPFGSGGFKGNSPVSTGYQQIQNKAMQGALPTQSPQPQPVQAQSDALGAISPPAGGGQTNMMKPMPAPAGGPYGGFNAQGQSQAQPQGPTMGFGGANGYKLNGGDGQNSFPVTPLDGQSQGQGNLGNYQPSQEAINTYDKWKADQDRPLGPGEMRNQMAMLDPRSPEAMQMQMMQANRAQQPQGQEQFQNNMMRPMPMPQPQGPMSVGAFSPQSPMGGFPQQPQGGGPDMTGMTPGSDMGYDRSGSDAGIGGQAVQGVQNPAGMGGKMPLAGGPYGGINPQTAGPMPVGNKPLSLPQLRPQQSGLQIAGNPSTQPVFNGRQRGMRR